MNWIIVGLGNPGTKYQQTRHNAGFIMLDFLHDKFDCSEWKKKLFSNATVSTGEYCGNILTLTKPETFMNLSGRAVQKYIKTKDDINRLIVIHDDVHIPIGTFKISVARGDGGHNGITSLHQTLKTKGFIRIRLGVAPVSNPLSADLKIKLDEFVLSKFNVSEKEQIEKISSNVERAISTIISKGIEQAMNEFNTK